MEFLKKYLTTEGRLNRLRYLKYSLILGFGSLAVSVILSLITALITGGDENSFPVRAVMWVVYFFWFVGYLTLIIRRLHDLDKPEYLVAIVFLPQIASIIGINILITLGGIANLAFGVYLLLAPGTKGKNQYGADPLR